MDTVISRSDFIRPLHRPRDPRKSSPPSFVSKTQGEIAVSLDMAVSLGINNTVVSWPWRVRSTATVAYNRLWKVRRACVTYGNVCWKAASSVQTQLTQAPDSSWLYSRSQCYTRVYDCGSTHVTTYKFRALCIIPCQLGNFFNGTRFV